MELSFSQKWIFRFRMLWTFFLVPVIVFATWLYLQSFLNQEQSVFAMAVLLAVLMGYLWYRLRGLPLQYATSAAAADSLAVSQAEFAYLFAHSPVPYVKVNGDGAITRANLAAVRLLASSTDQVTSINLFTLFNAAAEAEENNWLEAYEKISNGLPVSDVSCVLQTPHGHPRWVQLSVFARKERGQDLLVTLVDVTEQKKVDRAKSEFVALASHQLRTPIAAISWTIELLQQSAASLNEKQRAYSEKIAQNANRMKLLINDFLSVSQLETGTFEADRQQIDLTQYLSEIASEFEEAISKKQLALDLELPEQPLQWETDRRLLHIVTSNLISNATKYTPEQGVVRVGYQVANNVLTFWVADSGIGIPSNEIERLFTKFYRATNAQSSHSGGTGLGLYIVKQSVGMLGGDISVESVQDKGTRFTVTIPLQ